VGSFDGDFLILRVGLGGSFADLGLAPVIKPNLDGVVQDEGSGIHQAPGQEKGIGIHLLERVGEVTFAQAAEDDRAACFIIDGRLWNGDDIVHHTVVADQGDGIVFPGIAGCGVEFFQAVPHPVAPVGVGGQGGFSGVMFEFQRHTECRSPWVWWFRRVSTFCFA